MEQLKKYHYNCMNLFFTLGVIIPQKKGNVCGFLFFKITLTILLCRCGWVWLQMFFFPSVVMKSTFISFLSTVIFIISILEFTIFVASNPLVFAG